MPHSKNAHEAVKTPSLMIPLDRDRCILAFNERVLDWAMREEVPLLERLRFLCIVSSNLDEFFEVRAAQHLDALTPNASGMMQADPELTRLSTSAHALMDTLYGVFNDRLLPALAKQGIRLLSHSERTHAQRQWVKEYFDREVRPLLLPVGLDPAHPFPQVANKSLNFIVRLNGKDAFGRENDITIVKVPRVLPRLIRLPDRIAGSGVAVVSVSSVIRAHLHEMFAGREVTQFSQFRVTRHSDLAVEEDEVRNLRMALRQGLDVRHFGRAVRLEVASGCSEYLSDFLLRQFSLPPEALYREHGPVNLVRMAQLLDLVQAPKLLFPPFEARWPVELRRDQSFFERLQSGDVLIHQPFERFDAVLAFLREAVNDPQVLAIKQTIYRTGADSELMNLLLQGVRLGKEVTVVVELKARFDEEANINWAELLESVGAQVVYGVVGLKTHAKMLLVTRREGRTLRRYGHLSTGNYNPRTARLYTDISHLTADAQITGDMERAFTHIAGQGKLLPLKRMWMAPFHLQKNVIDWIQAAGDAAARGKGGRIVAKMNALTDDEIIQALVKAGQQGAKIDLIVRGACTLPAGVPGVTDNIRVRSIVGRFLEHTRVFYFRVAEHEELYLSSADWMNRNMLRRIELAWPISDAHARQRVIDECLVPYLLDDTDAWVQKPDGHYERLLGQPGQSTRSAQAALMGLHRHSHNVPLS